VFEEGDHVVCVRWDGSQRGLGRIIRGGCYSVRVRLNDGKEILVHAEYVFLTATQEIIDAFLDLKNR
jgi:hypothetical protein